MRLYVRGKSSLRVKRRQKVKARIRRQVFGTEQRPRITVFRSHRYLYVQCVDDATRKTLFGLNSRECQSLAEKNNQENAKGFGVLFGQHLLEKGIRQCVFDRSGYLYHGRVRQLAEGIRQAGVKT